MVRRLFFLLGTKQACRFLITSLAVATMVSVSLAQDIAIDSDDVTLGKLEYSPYLDRGYPQRVYCGDTHVHTAIRQTPVCSVAFSDPKKPIGLPWVKRSSRAGASAQNSSVHWTSSWWLTTPKIWASRL